MLSRETLARALGAALEKGGDFAEVFYEDRFTTIIFAEEAKIERVKTGRDTGAGIRVMRGESSSYAYTDDLSEESLMNAARVAGAAARDGRPLAVVDLRRRELPNPHRILVRPEDYPKDKKVDVLLRADRAARGVDPRIKQVSVTYFDSVQKVRIANSDGLWAGDERVLTRLAVNAIAAKGDEIQTGTESKGHHMGMEIFDRYRPEDIGARAAKQAITNLDARPAPSGPMTVVMTNGWGGVLFHEACGHGLEADHVQKKASAFAGRIGEKVASPIVTAIDGATEVNSWGSYVFDDEGQPAQRTVLIENGILRDYMYDLKAARKDGRASTGNGRRQSYQHLPLPRMTNTYIAPGKSDPREIIEATKEGFFAAGLRGGQVNTATGDFVFTVSEGYLIRDGKIAEPVRGATLAGNGPEALMKIDLALAMEKAALAADPRIKNVMSSSYGDGSHEITLVNSLGLHRSYKANYCSASLFLIAQDGASTQTGFAYDLGRSIESFDAEALAGEAAAMATSLLGAKPVASQQVPVVLHRFVGAQILGVLTSPLTAEAVQRGRSLFAGKMGGRVASELVDLVDDGILAGGMASAPFDGEGVPTARKELISSGILKAFMHNTYSARKEGSASTGNAARGSFRATPEVSPSNFYLAPGKIPADDVIRGVCDGFYVMELSGLGTGGANPISGELSVGATGRWIRNGELAEPVREVTIAGNLIKILRDVDAVANDLKFLGATGSPTFRVAAMSVGGKAK